MSHVNWYVNNRAGTHTHPKHLFRIASSWACKCEGISNAFPAKVRTWTNMVALQPVEYSEFGFIMPWYTQYKQWILIILSGNLTYLDM